MNQELSPYTITGINDTEEISPYAIANTDTNTNKLDLLEKNKAEKLARLTSGGLNQGANLEDSYSVINGNIDNNRNKVHNDYNPAEMQYLLGYASSKYYNDSGDSSNSRRAYLYDTKTGDAKAGVSTGGAATSDVRYNNAIDSKYQQDWRTSGAEGPDLSKKRYDLPMDFGAATVLEGLQHGNTYNLKNRKYPDVMTPEAIAAGSGTSEYYKGDGENFLGDSRFYNLTPERIKQIEEDFDFKVRQYNREKAAKNVSSDQLYAQAGGKLGRGEEAIDLMQSQGLKLYADMEDTTRSAARSLLSTLGASDETVDKWVPKDDILLGTGERISDVRKDQKLRDRMTGYDSRYDWEQEQKAFQDVVGKGKYGEAAWNVVTNLDRYLATSAPEMAVMFVPYVGIPAAAATRLNNQMKDDD